MNTPIPLERVVTARATVSRHELLSFTAQVISELANASDTSDYFPIGISYEPVGPGAGAPSLQLRAGKSRLYSSLEVSGTLGQTVYPPDIPRIPPAVPDDLARTLRSYIRAIDTDISWEAGLRLVVAAVRDYDAMLADIALVPLIGETRREKESAEHDADLANSADEE